MLLYVHLHIANSICNIQHNVNLHTANAGLVITTKNNHIYWSIHKVFHFDLTPVWLVLLDFSYLIDPGISHRPLSQLSTLKEPNLHLWGDLTHLLETVDL